MKLLIGGAIAAAALAVACGGGDDSQPATEDGLRSVAQAANEELWTGDPKEAYRYFTAECRDQLSYGEFAGQLAFGKAFLAGWMQIEVDDIEVEAVEVRNVADGHGETLTKLRSKADPDLNLNSDEDEWTPWVYEDGAWRSANCDEFEEQ